MPIRVLLSFMLLLAISLEAGALSQICRNGIKRHPKILSKLYSQESKDYALKQSKDQYLPQIDLSAQIAHNNYAYKSSKGLLWRHENFSEFTLSFRQAIYRPVLLKQIDDARARKILARYESEDQKANLITQIALNAIELLRLKQSRALAKKKVALYQKTYKDILSKFKSRFADRSALAQAKARLRQSQADYARYNQLFHYISNNLKFLSDIKSIPSSLLQKRFNALAATHYYRADHLHRLKQAIRRNTRVRIYRSYRNIAKNMIAMRRAERYPTLELRGSYRDGHYDNPATAKRNSQISLNFNMPIYHGGYLRDRINEAQAIYYAATEDLNNAILEAKSSIQKNWEQIQTGLQTLRALREAERASKVYYETAYNAYKNGLQSLTDSYQANIDYYNTKLRRINAEAELLSSIIRLYYTIGEATPKKIARFERRYLR